VSTATFNDFLERHPGIEKRNGLFYQRILPTEKPFEQHYTHLRKQEGRLYSDETAKMLPDISPGHPLANEWRIRKNSTDRLISFLKNCKAGKILEVGSGNGWLMHRIQKSLDADCLGIDINETELQQAVRISDENSRLNFLYADISSDLLDTPIADAIIVASVIQYFSEPTILIRKLQTLLKPGGAIHIIDTPFYTMYEVEQARARSNKYFEKLGHPEMIGQYFHHTWEVFAEFDYRVLHNPDSVTSRLRRYIDCNSPFPWIAITC
jgi:ubiquinone/menaquinone biosynthesis C-methylase UbiE